MDLQRMEDKLDAGKYSKFSEFKADFQLLVNNCKLYNGQDNGNYFNIKYHSHHNCYSLRC